MSNMKAPLPQCVAMVRIQNILSGKWKITILWYIAEYEVQRFGELRKSFIPLLKDMKSWSDTHLF